MTDSLNPRHADLELAPAGQPSELESLHPALSAMQSPAWKALAGLDRDPTRLGGAASVVAQLGSAMQSPAFKGLAGFDRDVTKFGGAASVVAQLGSAMQSPAFKALAGFDRDVTKFGGAASVVAQLGSAMHAFTVQHDSFRALTAVGVARNSLFAAQLGQITSTQDAISRLVLGTGVIKSGALFSSLGRYAEVQASLGSFVAADRSTLLRGLTRVPSRRYDSYLNGLPARPSARRSAVASLGGDAQSGMVIAESLTTLDLDDDDRHELAEQYTVEVLEPWQTGPSRAREDLFAQLATLAPDLPDWIKAAWDDIERDGPKAASKIAHCTVECIDRTLRVIADPDSVMAWVASVGAKPGWIDGGRPTRRAKIMFAMRHRSKRDASLADAQVEALIALVQNVVGNLQPVKHNEAPGIAVMRGMVQAAEAALSQLLL